MATPEAQYILIIDDDRNIGPMVEFLETFFPESTVATILYKGPDSIGSLPKQTTHVICDGLNRKWQDVLKEVKNQLPNLDPNSRFLLNSASELESQAKEAGVSFLFKGDTEYLINWIQSETK